MPDGSHSDSDVLSLDGGPPTGVAFVPEPAPPADRRGVPGGLGEDAGGESHASRGADSRVADSHPAGPLADSLPAPRPGFGGIALLAAAVLVAGLVAAGVPFLLDHRTTAAWESTAVELPEGWDGLPRTSGGEVQTLLRKLPGQRSLGAFQAGLYGDGTGETILVFAARSTAPLSGEEQATARRGFLEGFADRHRELRLRELDAGHLGGYFGCGQARGVTTCVSTDASSLVAVLVAKPADDPRATALAVREATVRRH